jgi:mannosidase alpha-like ER degradation enhancer 2
LSGLFALLFRCLFFQAELKPLSCSGGQFEPIKVPLVTLVDTLDTLVIMNNYSEFARAVALVAELLPNFDFDVSVSVFETTIRLLGGLLSAHLMAIDPALAIYSVRFIAPY